MQRRSPQISGGRSSSSLSTICCYHRTRLDLKINRVFQGDRAKCRRARKPSPLPEGSLSRTSSSQSIRPVISRSSLLCASGDTLYRSRSSTFSTSCTASYTTRALTLLSKINSWRDAGKTTNSNFARPGVSFSPSLTAGLFRASRSLLSCPVYLTACLYLLLFAALPLWFPPVSVVQLSSFLYTSAGEKDASVVLDSCGGSSSASFHDSIFDSVGRSSTTTKRTSTSGNPPFSYLFAEAVSFAHHVKSSPLSLCTPRPLARDFLHLPVRTRAETTRPSDLLVSFWPRKSSRHSTYPKWHLPVPPEKFAFLSSRPFPLSPCPHSLGAYFLKLASGSTPLEQYSYTGENVTLRQQFLPRGCYCFCLSQFPALFATTCRSHTLGSLPRGGNFSASRVSSTPRWSILPAAAAAGVRYGQRDTRIRFNEKGAGAPEKSLRNFPCASRTNAAGGKIRGRAAAVAADKQSLIRSGTVADSLNTSSDGNPPATTRTSSNTCRSAATCSSSSRSAATSSSKRVSTTSSSICVSTTPSSTEDIAAPTSGSSSISNSLQGSGSSNTSSKGHSSCIEDRTTKRATRLHNSSACRRRSRGSLSGISEARTDAIIGMGIHRCDTAPLRVCKSRSSGNRVVTSVNSSESKYGASSSMCTLEEKTAGHCSNSSDDGHVVRDSGNTSVDNTSTAAGPGVKSCTGVYERESDSLGRTKGSSRTQPEEGVRSSYRPAAAKDPGSRRGNGFKVNSCCRSSGGESNGGSSSIQSAQVSINCEVRSTRENAESCRNSGGSSSSGSERIVNRDETKAERSSFDRNSTSRGLRLAAVPTRLGLLGDLQQVQQGCFIVASTAKQLLAAVWSRWKGAAGKEGAEMTFLRSSRRRIKEILKVFLLHLPSCAARLHACLSVTDGDGRRRSWWWSQQQQVFLSVDGRSQRLTAAAAGPTVEAAAAAAARISAAAAARREEAAAAARIVRATIQTAAETSRTVADAIVAAAMKAVRAAGEAIGGTGQKASWSSQWIPLLLPPPLPPVGQLLQTLLLLSYVTDSFVLKGKLLELLAFDMRRESLLRGSNSRNGCDVSCAKSSNRRNQRKNGGFFSASFMAFCVRAAAAGLVHSNWLHLLVNLHGIRQLLPLCERLCYDAICSSKTAVRNSAAGRFVGGAAAAAALPTSNGLFSQGWSWFWKPGAATEAAAAPATARAASAASSVAAAARRCLGGPSTVAAEKHRKGYEWLPKLSVLHGPHGREGWWARVVVMLLFTWGCAAGNVTSFYLRRWWRRMELFMEQQQRQQALKRKLWGGTFPEGDACDSDDFFEDAEAAEAGPGAAQEGGAALAAAPRGGAWAGSDAAAPSCGSSDGASSDAPAAASRRDGCPAAEAEAQAAAAFFETLGGGGPARRTSSSREGREPDGTRAPATATAAEDDKEGLLHQKNSQQTRKSGLMKREEKAWERQLRLQKMRRTQQRHASCSRETGDSSSGSAGSSSRHGLRDTAAAENWPSFGGEGVTLRAKEEGTATTAEQDDTREEGEVELDDEELDEEILDETAVVADDREWCVRTVGCSAGLYSLLGLLVGSARIGSTTKKSIVKQIFKKIVTEFFMPTGVDEPGHLGGFIFGYLAANLLQW